MFVASTVEEGDLLVPSVDIAMGLARIRTTQQYPMLTPTLFLGQLVAKENIKVHPLYVDRVSYFKYNTTPAIDGDAFAPVSQTRPLTLLPTTTSASAVSDLQRRRPG